MCLLIYHFNDSFFKYLTVLLLAYQVWVYEFLLISVEARVSESSFFLQFLYIGKEDAGVCDCTLDQSTCVCSMKEQDKDDDKNSTTTKTTTTKKKKNEKEEEKMVAAVKKHV